MRHLILVLTVLTLSSPAHAGLISVQVAASGDDSWETGGGINPSFDDLRLGRFNSNVVYTAMRFTDINIARGSTIESAVVTFEAFGSGSSTVFFTYRGFDEDNASDFSPGTGPFSGRPTTTAGIAAPSEPAWIAGQQYDSPNLKTIIQEIIDRDGWVEGNALAVRVTGGGLTSNANRRAKQWDFDPSGAARITIQFTPVPEPSLGRLIGVGLLAFGAVSRIRRCV